MFAPMQTTNAPEARSGLDPWTRADLPAPPVPKGLSWIGVVGPGVIVLGLSIGSGEFLVGPPGTGGASPCNEGSKRIRRLSRQRHCRKARLHPV